MNIGKLFIRCTTILGRQINTTDYMFLEWNLKCNEIYGQMCNNKSLKLSLLLNILAALVK